MCSSTKGKGKRDSSSSFLKNLEDEYFHSETQQGEDNSTTPEPSSAIRSTALSELRPLTEELPSTDANAIPLGERKRHAEDDPPKERKRPYIESDLASMTLYRRTRQHATTPQRYIPPPERPSTLVQRDTSSPAQRRPSYRYPTQRALEFGPTTEVSRQRPLTVRMERFGAYPLLAGQQFAMRNALEDILRVRIAVEKLGELRGHVPILLTLTTDFDRLGSIQESLDNAYNFFVDWSRMHRAFPAVSFHTAWLREQDGEVGALAKYISDADPKLDAREREMGWDRDIPRQDLALRDAYRRSHFSHHNNLERSKPQLRSRYPSDSYRPDASSANPALAEQVENLTRRNERLTNALLDKDDEIRRLKDILARNGT